MQRSLTLASLVAVLTLGSANVLAVPTASDAKGYIAKLDAAIKDATPALQRGDLKSLGEQSRRINALQKDGEAFGKTVLDEPYGYCLGAGIQAATWWNAQLSAAKNGGVERPAGAVASAAKEYHSHRAACLDAVNNPKPKTVTINSTSDTPPRKGCLAVLGKQPNGEFGPVAYTCPAK
ncbi:hypothetical protein [Comamonas thiooxydans]|uniref:hypothetical protein n=1 Tax=Comamonas thiooxydans TaxID=363952 RepID=UPI0015A73724|nr:hypothetical protein [Comamonas thiooxydans]